MVSGIARLAQLVEQLIYTEKVGGSSPSPRTKNKIPEVVRGFYFVGTRGLGHT